MEVENLCTNCKNARDRWHDACYCVHYGIIISHKRDRCWGYDPKKENEEEENHAEANNHR